MEQARGDGVGRSDGGTILTFSLIALLAGQVTAILADRLNNIALIGLLSEHTDRFAQAGSTFELSKLALAMTLPALILGPLAGAYVDRSSRRRVLVASDVVRGAAALAIPLLQPALPFWTVYGMVALLYIGGLFFVPARCAIVPEIVARPNLLRANSLITLGSTLATIAGFSLGGILVTRAGWRTALVADAACYFLSASALAMLPASPAAPGEKRGPAYFSAIAGAVREVRRLAGARMGIVIPPLIVAAGSATYVLGVAMIEKRFEHGTMAIGFLTSLAGVGMAAGGYLTATFLKGPSRERVMLGAALIAIASLAAVAFTGQVIVVAAGILIAGFAAGPVFVVSETAIQEEATHRRQGTTFAVRDALMRLASAGAAVVAPLVGALVGLRPALPIVLAALLVTVALSAALTRPSRAA